MKTRKQTIQVRLAATHEIATLKLHESESKKTYYYSGKVSDEAYRKLSGNLQTGNNYNPELSLTINENSISHPYSVHIGVSLKPESKKIVNKRISKFISPNEYWVYA
jgi:hypothetical protein